MWYGYGLVVTKIDLAILTKEDKTSETSMHINTVVDADGLTLSSNLLVCAEPPPGAKGIPRVGGAGSDYLFEGSLMDERLRRLCIQ